MSCRRKRESHFKYDHVLIHTLINLSVYISQTPNVVLQLMAGQFGLRGGNVLYPVEWVFSLDTGSVWVCSLQKVGLLVWAHTDRTKYAFQPHVTVSLL